MGRSPISGTKGLYKNHTRGCGNRGGKPTKCDCPWSAKYKHAQVSLSKWTGKSIDPRVKGPADAAVARLIVAVDSGVFRREGEKASIATDQTMAGLIRDYKREWIERRGLSQSVYPMLDVIERGLGAYPLSYLVGDDGPALIEKWLNEQHDERGWSNATWNHYRDTLSTLFNRARKWRQVKAANPIEFIDPMVVERDAPNTVRIEEEAEARLFVACARLDEVQVRRNRTSLTWELVNQIRARAVAGVSQKEIAADVKVSEATISEVVRGRTWNPDRASEYSRGREMYRRLAAAFDLGLRRTEMLDLTLAMVDFDPAVVEIDGVSQEVLVIKLPARMTKGGKRTGQPEYVYAGTTRIKDVLRERRNALAKNPPERQYAFGLEDGSREASFDRSAKRLFELAGLRWDRHAGVIWHTVRHEYVSRTLENTGDPVVAQAMARHKDGKTTQGYMHARPTRLLQAAVGLDRAIAKPTSSSEKEQAAGSAAPASIVTSRLRRAHNRGNHT
jgi:site-specific recombinase XerD